MSAGAGGAGGDTGTTTETCKPGNAEAALVCFPPSSDTSYPFLMSGLRFKYPNPSGYPRSPIAGINAHGVAVGTYLSCQDPRAFSYADGLITWLSDERSGARAINDKGTIVGFIGAQAVMWRNGEISWLSYVDTVAVNEHDQVLLRHDQAASLWTDGGGPGGGATLIGQDIDVHDLNDLGEVVGVRFDTDRAFVWKDGVFHDLPPLNGDSTSYANAINNQGQVVGRSGNHPVIWENGIPRLLSPEPIDSEVSVGDATDINHAGSVVGTLGFGTFLYSSGAFTRVGSVRDNLKINDNGVIIGDSYIWSPACYDICCNAAAAQ